MFISECFPKWTHARNHHLEQGLEHYQASQKPLLSTPSNCPPKLTTLLTFVTDYFGVLSTLCKWNKVRRAFCFLILWFSGMFVSSIHDVPCHLFIVICSLGGQCMHECTIIYSFYCLGALGLLLVFASAALNILAWFFGFCFFLFWCRYVTIFTRSVQRSDVAEWWSVHVVSLSRHCPKWWWWCQFVPASAVCEQSIL